MQIETQIEMDTEGDDLPLVVAHVDVECGPFLLEEHVKHRGLSILG